MLVKAATGAETGIMPEKLGQYEACWYPVQLRRQTVRNPDTGFGRQRHPSFP